MTAPKVSPPPAAVPPAPASAPFATGAWLSAVLIDAVMGLFYAAGGALGLAAGAELAADAEEAAVNFHSALIYLSVGLVLIAAAAVLLMRRPWSYVLGVWLNSLGVITAVFMFARLAIVRATAALPEGVAGPTPVTVTMIVMLVIQTALFSLAIRQCMRLEKQALAAVAQAAAGKTAPDDNILPPVRR